MKRGVITTEILDMEYEQQKEQLIHILDSLHRDRPLMNVNDMLVMIMSLQKR